jgi:hypothetical protein
MDIHVLTRTKVLREPGERFKGHKDMPVARPFTNGGLLGI